MTKGKNRRINTEKRRQLELERDLQQVRSNYSLLEIERDQLKEQKDFLAQTFEKEAAQVQELILGTDVLRNNLRFTQEEVDLLRKTLETLEKKARHNDIKMEGVVQMLLALIKGLR